MTIWNGWTPLDVLAGRPSGFLDVHQLEYYCYNVTYWGGLVGAAGDLADGSEMGSCSSVLLCGSCDWCGWATD
jgi:hypothetical protein